MNSDDKPPNVGVRRDDTENRGPLDLLQACEQCRSGRGLSLRSLADVHYRYLYLARRRRNVIHFALFYSRKQNKKNARSRVFKCIVFRSVSKKKNNCEHWEGAKTNNEEISKEIVKLKKN